MSISTRNPFSLVTTFLVVVVAFGYVGCDSGTSVEDREYNAPLSLSGVEYQSPDSSAAPEQIGPGDVIVLKGQNLDAVQRLYFNGVETSFNPTFATNQTLIATVPSDLPFGELDPDAETFGTIRVENERSESVLDFDVLPAEPTLSSMSNEYATPGTQVTVYGGSLYLAESVTLPGGTTIPGDAIDFNAEGTEATFTIPEGANLEPGPLVYETASGTDESTPDFLFLDDRNILFNVDDYSAWGGFSALLSPDAEDGELSGFRPGARGEFAVLQGTDGAAIPGGGNNLWYNSGRSINLNDQQWIAPENLDEPAGNFAVKFEMNLRQPWEAGSILIYLIETASNNYETGYGYRYHAWEEGEEGEDVVPASWEGWQTVTIPFDEFRTMYGADEGTTTSSLTDLLGDDGVVGHGGPDNNPTSFRLINYGEGTVAAGQAFAIDNIRVSRIDGGAEEE